MTELASLIEQYSPNASGVAADEPDLEEQDEDATAPLWRELAAKDAASIFRGVPLS